tara:strand:+ start:4773 stop:4988 length:216 start_codon:yes stop_codon:yes gene_type:complete
MPTPFMCHECDSPTMNRNGICNNCIEPTTADEFNKALYKKNKNILFTSLKKIDKKVHNHKLGIGFSQKDYK